MSDLSVKTAGFCYFFCSFLDIPQSIDQLHNGRKKFAFAYSVINTPKLIRNQNIEKLAQFQF